MNLTFEDLGSKCLAIVISCLVASFASAAYINARRPAFGLVAGTTGFGAVATATWYLLAPAGLSKRKARVCSNESL